MTHGDPQAKVTLRLNLHWESPEGREDIFKSPISDKKPSHHFHHGEPEEIKDDLSLT
eukprot:CAMPEP_0114591240 /NCGR_PEP_ID=MMETSP0125-20121206/13336_1 /TAXON_ID=485358 ORGANISM="Aristerostoma sp., Strain ATCC 50986" /NCGR_SAMPLE_ID=MMETSP0125 /ASSEMBLY_ACC=CAM_ASM_000245 /LENGTH=56 /DNA_ID=CAMNT_0001789225 /DNA_START=371 /DNA_END=541 /DNA_ORIENTATION=-